MKNIKHNFTKLFTLLIMAAMSMGVWADNVSIPQDFESYIVLGSATGTENFATYISTKENCTVDSRLAVGSNYYTIGTKENAATATFAIDVITNAEGEGDYEFGFKTGAANEASSTVDVTIQKSGEATSTTIATNEVVLENGNWNPTIPHRFAVSGLEASSIYTITITATKTSGKFCGNFGNFYFHKFTQYPTMPTDGTTYVNLSGGTYYKSKYNDDAVVSDLDNEGYMDNIVLNNTTAGYFKMNFNVKDYKADGTLKATIYDYFTGITETSNTVTVTSNGNKTVILGSSLTAGLKRIRFDFTGTQTSGTIFNYRNVSFLSWIPDALPITGTAVLDMSKGSIASSLSGSPRYASNGGTNNEISYIYNNGYADEFYVIVPEKATYELKTVTSNYNKGGTFKVTITDVETGTVEINAQESQSITSNNQSISMQLNNPITQGLKKLRFDFVKEGESEWLYNIKDVSFSALRYTREHPHMNLNTLCFPYQIDNYTGATFYTMFYKVMDGETVTDIYLQEHEGNLVAGTPYFYVPEEGSAELVCHYSGDREETPQKVNGVQGAYADNTAVPGGAFVTYNNNLQAVTGGYVTLGEYRAYVDMNEVPKEGAVAHLPGRKMLKIRNADAPAVTTDVEEVQRDNVLCTKVIENGVLYLKYNGTMYNVQGMRVK